MSSPPEECRKNADVCLGMAGRTPNPSDKDMWLRLANSWLKLARLEQEAEARKSEGFHSKLVPATAPPSTEARQPFARTKKRKAG